MKLSDLLSLTILNIRCDKWVMARFSAAIIIILMLVSSAFHLFFSFESGIKEFTSKNSDNANIDSTLLDCSYEEATGITDKTFELLKKSKLDFSSASVGIYYMANEEELQNEMMSGALNKTITMLCGKETYSIDMAYSQNYCVYAFDPSCDIFSDYEDIEAVGEPPRKSNEIMLSFSFLEEMGIASKEAEELIGKTVTLTDTNTQEMYLDKLTVCGIYCGDFQNYAAMCVTNECIGQSQCCFSYKTNSYYFNTFSDAEAAYDLLESNNIPVSCTISVSIYSMAERIRAFVTEILLIVIPVVAVVLLLTIWASTHYRYKSASARRSLYSLLGMSNSSAGTVLALENTIVIAISAIIAFLASMLLNLLLGGYLENQISIWGKSAFTAGAVSVWHTVSFFSALTVLVIISLALPHIVSHLQKKALQ